MEPFSGATPATQRHHKSVLADPKYLRSPSSCSGIPSTQAEDDSKSIVRRWQRILFVHIAKMEKRSPMFRKTMNTVRRVPPRWRVIFLICWLLWKVISAYIVIRLALTAATTTAGGLGYKGVGRPRARAVTTAHPKTKILYIVTALAEFNSGARNTIRGQDRLAEVLIPVVVDSVESILAEGSFDVDVYLVLGYQLKPERRRLIENRLPPLVGLEVWDDAIPMGYTKENGKERVSLNTRALARQHRFVVKDKLPYYDAFVALEDDMRIAGVQLRHFLTMSDQLADLHDEAPETTEGVPETLYGDPKDMKFFGAMTEGQMKRLVPGWIRVEVLTNKEGQGAQEKLDPIPLDYDFSEFPGVSRGKERHLDASICCDITNMDPPPRGNLNLYPNASDVIIWETNIKALQLREMPRYEGAQPVSDMLDWVVLLLGPGKREKEAEKVGGYWSGRNGAFGDFPRPHGGPPDLIAQQGGWVLTRRQIMHLNDGLCAGSFLPPFSKPIYHDDGQQAMNVEYWSGSYQIFTGVRGGCNMQRIMSFHPDHFSKHLLYHTANNKQKQLKQERMVRADHLFGQLNSVYKEALKAKSNLLSQ